MHQQNSPRRGSGGATRDSPSADSAEKGENRDMLPAEQWKKLCRELTQLLDNEVFGRVKQRVLFDRLLLLFRKLLELDDTIELGRVRNGGAHLSSTTGCTTGCTFLGFGVHIFDFGFWVVNLWPETADF